MSHRPRRRRPTAGLTVAATVAAAVVVLPGGPAAAEPDPQRFPAAVPGTGAHTVTLVTGDRVRVGAGQVTVEPARGREKIGFARYLDAGDTYVVPADALTLVSAGRVDRRLFNITKLVRYGYDDRSQATFRLIVTASGNPALASAAAIPGTTVVRELPSVGATAVRAHKNDAATLWAAVTGGVDGVRAFAGGVGKLMLDGPVRATIADSVPQIAAPAAWQAGYTGEGTTVAVVDSGIDTRHPDLADAVIDSVDLSGSATGADDVYGHGTHVAGIITGSGVAADGTFRGVAPDTKLLNAKVLDDFGGGSESTIVAGLEWAAAKGAKVVNVSVGSDFDADGTDVMSAAVDRLTARTGALFVVAAGNGGPGPGTIGSPAAARSALTVGAVDRDNRLARFSARGPRHLDDGVKPDITAPGVGIGSAYARNGHTVGPYLVLSGTSMSAPHVAGAAAILAAQNPTWSAARLKAVLMGTAVPTGGLSVYEQGAGRVDVGRAVTQQVYSSTANLDHGVVAWPHTDDAPVVSPVTFVNRGASAVTLTLGTDVRGPAGAAPADMFTVDRTTLTVPPGGEATATVTMDPRVATPTGVYGGVVTATDPAGTTVRIPVGVHVEEERYDLTVSLRDRAGTPSGNYWLQLVSLSDLATYTAYDPDGTVTLRLPRGRYQLHSLIRPAGAAQAGEVVVGVEPAVDVTGDRTLTISGGEAAPVRMQVARAGATAGRASLDFLTRIGDGRAAGFSWVGSDNTFGGVLLRRSGTKAPGRFTFTAETNLAQAGTDGVPGSFRNSPYLYNLRFVSNGRVPAGVNRTYADSDLATVATRLAAPAAAGTVGYRNMVAMDLPATLTEYFTPGHPWYPDFAQYTAFNRDHLISTPARVYAKGQQATAAWNTAVYGPSMPLLPGRLGYAERVGDSVSFGIPMWGDGGTDSSGSTSLAADQKTVLYQGDRIVGEYRWGAGQGYFTVPTAASTYRLHTELTQTALPLSRRISVDWTFGSAPGVGNEVLDLPLHVVRYSPTLDEYNRAPSGEPFSFTVAVHRNGAGVVRTGITLDLQASFDDGATWAPVPVAASGDRWTATLTHPVGAGHVSLKATAADTAGSSVDQTIIRAYALR